MTINLHWWHIVIAILLIIIIALLGLTAELLVQIDRLKTSLCRMRIEQNDPIRTD